MREKDIYRDATRPKPHYTTHKTLGITAENIYVSLIFQITRMVTFMQAELKYYI